MATAQPAIQAPAFYTDRWGPSVAFPTLNGDYLHLFATVLSPDQPNQVTAVATQGAIVRNMAFFSGPIFAEKNFESYLTNTSLTGPWNLTVTDTHGSTNGSFAAIADPEFLPLMQNVQVSGAGTTPTVSWTLPNLSGFDVDAIRVRAVIAGTGVQIFQSALLPTTTSSFSFQSGVLALGETYEFRILLEDFVGQMEENRSNTFSPLLTTTVAAVPEPESWRCYWAAWLCLQFDAELRGRRNLGQTAAQLPPKCLDRGVVDPRITVGNGPFRHAATGGTDGCAIRPEPSCLDSRPRLRPAALVHRPRARPCRGLYRRRVSRTDNTLCAPVAADWITRLGAKSRSRLAPVSKGAIRQRSSSATVHRPRPPGAGRRVGPRSVDLHELRLGRPAGRNWSTGT